MKKIISLLSLTAIVLNGSAEVLTPEQALSRLSTSDSRKTIELVAKQQPELIDTKSINNIPAVYMFSDSYNGNFILVSADDLVEPLLGYGSWQSGKSLEHNASLQCWIEEYAAQIEWIRNHVTTGRNAVKSVSHSDKETILPLVTTTWNQDDPYNYMCPTYFGGEYHYPTGCGATAMAQILNYFKL